ncbi:MAG TPA: hypothetical protein VIT83_06410 [Gammaproteobacteria bacterium]
MRLIGLAVGVLLLLPIQATVAMGLGDLRVESTLNQNLNARIDLVKVKVGDIDAMTVRLADPDTFASAGLKRSHVLNQLKFEPVSTAESSGYIKITSRERIREPYLNFIIEVQWPDGKVMREYTVLLRTP